MDQYVTWPTLTDLNHGEPFQGLCQYLFEISLDKCNGEFNTPDDRSCRIYVLKETEHITLNVFNMKITINESQTIIKFISCRCRWKFESRKCNSNQKCNYQCKCKNPKKNLNRTCACECVKIVTLMIIWKIALT